MQDILVKVMSVNVEKVFIYQSTLGQSVVSLFVLTVN